MQFYMPIAINDWLCQPSSACLHVLSLAINVRQVNRVHMPAALTNSYRQLYNWTCPILIGGFEL